MSEGKCWKGRVRVREERGSMEFRCVRDLRSQEQLVDSKMMVESKTVAFDTLPANRKPLSRRMKKKSAIYNE